MKAQTVPRMAGPGQRLPRAARRTEEKDLLDVNRIRVRTGPSVAYSGSVRKISRSSQGATRRMLVVPLTLNGTPAVTTIWSLSVAKP